MGAVFLFKWYNGSYIAGLLFQIKQGFNPKKKRNLPNKLYLADLEVTAKDVYIKKDFANKTAETLDTSGHHEIGRRQENNKTAETLDTSGHHEIGHNLYKTNLDTNKVLIKIQACLIFHQLISLKMFYKNKIKTL
ncbi:hypothetical protein QK908_11530 [Lactococcus cremoris]